MKVMVLLTNAINDKINISIGYRSNIINISNASIPDRSNDAQIVEIETI